MPPSRTAIVAGLVLVLGTLAGCVGSEDASNSSIASDDPEPASGDAAPSSSNRTDEDAGEASGSNGTDEPEPSPDPPDEGNTTGQETNATGPFDPGWPPVEDATVRPGVKIAGGCTSNFVFSSPDNRTLYLGTAGHCVADVEEGDSVVIRGGEVEGTLAFASSGDGLDFALVELPDQARGTVHPSVLELGGPSGLAESVQQGDRVFVFGNSPYRDPTPADDLDAREGYAVEGTNRTTEYHLYNPTVGGDSGSPVLTVDGRALASHANTGVDAPVEEGDDYPCVGCSTGYNIALGLERAQEEGLAVELKTWPFEATPELPALPAAAAP